MKQEEKETWLNLLCEVLNVLNVQLIKVLRKIVQEDLEYYVSAEI